MSRWNILRPVVRSSIGPVARSPLRRTKGDAAPLTPLAPNAASQPMLAAYGLRRINPDYTGPILSVGINGVPTACYADADGWVDLSILGVATEGYVRRIYDQSADGAGTGRYIAWDEYVEPVIYPGVGPVVNGDAKCRMAMRDSKVLPDVTVDVGGTNNIAVFAVFDTLGYPGTERPGAHAESGVRTNSILGYGAQIGDNNDNQLLTSIYDDGIALATCEAVPYALVGEGMELNKPITPPLTGGPINVWFNQSGATMAGGGDARTHWTGATHGKAAATDQPLVLGRPGSGGPYWHHNGWWYEVIVYNPAAALSNTECARIALHQRLGYDDALVDTRVPEAIYINPIGQSNAANFIDANTSWSGSYTTQDYNSALRRIGTPLLASLLDKHDDDFNMPPRLTPTAYSQSALLKDAVNEPVADPTAQGSSNAGVYNPPRGGNSADLFWWDTTLDIPGPCFEGWKARMTADHRLFRASRAIQFWVQGEQEVAGMVYNTAAQTLYRTTFYKLVRAMREALDDLWGITDVPVFVMPIAHRSNVGAGGFAEGHWNHYHNLERIVDEAASQSPAVADVYWCANTGHLDLHSDEIHWARGPAVGGVSSSYGYDNASKQLAYSIASQYYNVANTKWQGPAIVSADSATTTTVDLTCAWDANGGGTALAGRDGRTTGLFGFEVRDGSGARTVTDASITSATVIRVTVSGAALSGTVEVRYNPHQYTEEVETRPGTVIDNNGAMPLPLQTSAWVTAT